MSTPDKRRSTKLGPAPTRLRQIALVTRDLEQAKLQLVGEMIRLHIIAKLMAMQTHVIGTEVIFEDPLVEQFGLRNFLGMPPIDDGRLRDGDG